MMKTPLANLWASVCLAVLPTFCVAQTENPRGVYKMTWLEGKQGKVKAPFDQYKICTDSVTLMMSVQGNQYQIGKNDSNVFNYTGEAPDANDSTATRIFDSNAEHFTLKWWSTTPFHLHFPHNDWCTEYYESNQYSENGKKILDALMSPPAHEAKNPLIGTWRLIGFMDELRNVKKELKRIKEKPMEGIYTVFTPEYIVALSRSIGLLYPAPNPYNKRVFKVGKDENKITWLSPDLIAVEIHQDYRTDYEILERATQETAFDGIASHAVRN